MESRQRFTSLGTDLLAEAFPADLRVDAMKAAEATFGQLHLRQWTDRFSVCVEGRAVIIPHRLRFVPGEIQEDLEPRPRLMARCLETRSNDGFHRQRAIRHVLSEVEPWSVPFIVALIGEYVIEILRDIDGAMSPELIEAATIFARANPPYWDLTRQRVASYWDVYYRALRRSEYVGFGLVGRIDAALEVARQG